MSDKRTLELLRELAHTPAPPCPAAALVERVRYLQIDALARRLGGDSLAWDYLRAAGRHTTLWLPDATGEALAWTLEAPERKAALAALLGVHADLGRAAQLIGGDPAHSLEHHRLRWRYRGERLRGQAAAWLTLTCAAAVERYRRTDPYAHGLSETRCVLAALGLRAVAADGTGRARRRWVYLPPGAHRTQRRAALHLTAHTDGVHGVEVGRDLARLVAAHRDGRGQVALPERQREELRVALAVLRPAEERSEGLLSELIWRARDCGPGKGVPRHLARLLWGEVAP